MGDITSILKRHRFIPNPFSDQFFLIGDSAVEKMVSLAELKPTDVVMEIGAGTGTITRKVAQRVKRVIAFEIDQKLKPFFSDLPKNVEMHFENAHRFFCSGDKRFHTREFNKIVSNIPYSICEWLFHCLTYLLFDKVILMIPNKFFYSSQSNPVFSSFFRIESKFEVDRTDFFPKPKTNSRIIELHRVPDPIESRDVSLFLRQFLYQHESWKSKNILREGLIQFI